METLMIQFIEKAKSVRERDMWEKFSKFYDLDLSELEKWMKSLFDFKLVRNNERSKVYREEGNKYFGQGNFMKSIECYTRSMCWAIRYGEEYATAVANRSAVSFVLEKYEECLKDIDICLNADYPVHLRPKVLIRKVECYLNLQQEEDFKQAIQEAQEFLQRKRINKVKFIKRLKELKATQISLQPKREPEDDCNEIPKLENENPIYAYAASNISFKKTTDRGRRVFATKHFKKGEILFVEKAFVFAPVFKDKYELASYKCYNCLKDIISCIPCKHCTVCVFCDRSCRSTCWEEMHKWECEGMQVGVWYHLGIAFPAFRALLKGVKCGFRHEVSIYRQNSFGSKEENYDYFVQLISHYRFENQEVVLAALVVIYLKKYTNFFQYVLEYLNNPLEPLDNLIRTLGAILVGHISQIGCNATVIEHWVYSKKDLLFPDTLVSTATAVFPSVSLMNHACKPNIATFFVADTIVVKALERIPNGKEIVNCYGIDYRAMNKEQRKLATQWQYNFICDCEICSNPKREVMDVLDTYLCSECNGPLPMNPLAIDSTCKNCKTPRNLSVYRQLNEQADKLLQRTDHSEIQNLIDCLQLKLKILNPLHSQTEELYYNIYRYYLTVDDLPRRLTFLRNWITVEEARRGKDSRNIGTEQFETAFASVRFLERNKFQNLEQTKNDYKMLNDMLASAKEILMLYYPKYIINKANKKIGFKTMAKPLFPSMLE